MIILSIIVLVVICSIILAWNFYPPFRSKMRGLSTVIEAVIGGSLYYFGILSDALQEAQASGIVPDNWAHYVPFVLLTWVILKRFQTTTRIGEL